MAKVFLSYRHVEPDQSIAKFVYRYLADCDHDVFFDAEDLSVGAFWHKEIRASVEQAEWFIPLISLSYLNSPYILEHELSVATELLKKKKIEGILQVNLAFDGTPPGPVKDVVTQIQFLKWRSSDDTPKLAQDLAERLPPPRVLVKGMRPFSATDGPLFENLGRAERISQFVAALNEPANRLILLHGVSGSGKTSFIKAGVLSKVKNAVVCELEHDTPEELDAVLSSDSAAVILDQFEQSLIRLSVDHHALAAFAAGLESRLQNSSTGKLVFCIRDEYRTPFDTMLPAIARRCTLFPLLPLEVDTAADVLKLLLDNIRVKYDPDFLAKLCADLAEGAPRTILPALLQLIAQRFSNHKLSLNGSSWDRLRQPGNSLFEQHVRGVVAQGLTLPTSQLEAYRCLAALTSGEVKSAFKSAAIIADEYALKEETVRRTMNIAAQPNARIVTVQVDSQTNHEQYRLTHDLFAPAVQSLAHRAEVERAKRHRLLLTAAVVFTAVAVAFVFGLLYRRAEIQRRAANSLRLVAQAQLNQNAQPDLALLLGIEAYKMADNFEARNGLLGGLQRNDHLLSYLRHPAAVKSIAFQPGRQARFGERRRYSAAVGYSDAPAGRKAPQMRPLSSDQRGVQPGWQAASGDELGQCAVALGHVAG